MNVLTSLSKFSLGIFFIGALALSGCSVAPVRIKSSCEPKIPLNIQKTPPLNLSKVQWIIITPKNADKVFSELKKNNNEVVLFGLTASYYENLGIDLGKIRNYIVINNQKLQDYKNYYEPSTKKNKN